ncbi:MAG: DNA methyltransferase [Armatimonadota bacterium]|nr:DNA methyltransferase [Armatimonadota bacterium]
MRSLSLKGMTKVPVGNHSGARYDLVHEDCFLWMRNREEATVEAIVTDPPFGLVEYSDDQLTKLQAGKGGVWRIPPELDGVQRKPLPRFTVLRQHEVDSLVTFFELWGREALRILVPGAHLIIAGNPLLSPLVASALMAVGFERRGEIIRLVRTLRGGDRPKLAEREYGGVSVMARSCYEPWGVFRKPLRERTVADNLRRWKTGGLRRTPDGRPFPDVLKSETPPANEEAIAPHPSLKPQRFMRQIAWAALPLGEGVVLDPFMGSGSTVSAAVAVGYKAIGIEKQRDFFVMAERAVPKLAVLDVNWESFESYNGGNSRS